MHQICGISIDEKILASVDRRRGLIPRSRFIEKIIEDTLEVSA